ncbi:L-threonylcarbamoyladenylate synthase [Fulvivirga sediminis]|uniref:Threonylcarbamoyl-AMP synthase n=1 Tax=Fulvivirga sediminis TaxID=2803949 RepID=A0A937K2L8_9BACT|nr:L-threonylcarbamoyladenylate synthase [Fulvivirga sediminis]MBL3658510.1 threonylcarbamoyl-AMP synthase [Fulvivirga sediminis]
MAEIGKDIDYAQSLLERGALVAIPTETVYGLAGNAFNPKAVAHIFEVKQRPAFDPLIAHTHSLEALTELVTHIPEAAQKLADACWPGPLTLLLPRKSIIPDLVTSGLETVAVRIPKQELTLELLRQLSFPLVAPSANPFGYVSPTTAEHVNDQLGHKIDYILNGGACQIGIESTIVGFNDAEQPTIYRLGGTSKESIEKVIGPVHVNDHSSSNPKAPGMLASHYSPGKKIILGSFEELQAYPKNKSTAAITFSRPLADINEDYAIILAKDGEVTTAAQHLFAALRALDRPEVEVILAEKAPEHGLGLAINDRLKRAAVK